MTNEYLTTKEAAEYLGVSPVFIGALSIGSIVPLKFTAIGKRRVFTKADLDDWSKRRDELISDGALPINYGRSQLYRRESKTETE